MSDWSRCFHVNAYVERLINPGLTGQSEPCRERCWGWTHTSTQREEVRRRRLRLPRRPGTWRSASARVESRRTAWRAAVRSAAARRGCCSPSLQRHGGKRGHRYTDLNHRRPAYTDGRNNSRILHLSGHKRARCLIQNQSVNALCCERATQNFSDANWLRNINAFMQKINLKASTLIGLSDLKNWASSSKLTWSKRLD